jgi:6-pyruvoyltetrahydropterin/6-carboxytetrahydropterin synthase
VTYRIGRSFTFDAAHHLPGLPEGHKCARAHGHTYTVTVTLERDDLVPPGFVTDFAELAPLEAYIAERLDHRDLNEVLDFPPTSELLARHLSEWFVEHVEHVEPGVAGSLVSVRVAEAPASWAEYHVGER